MTAVPPEVREELEKAISLVTTARRLLATGTTVDLSALEGKVRFICTGLTSADRDSGRALVPEMEALIAQLDRLTAALDFYYQPLSDQNG